MDRDGRGCRVSWGGNVVKGPDTVAGGICKNNNDKSTITNQRKLLSIRRNVDFFGTNSTCHPSTVGGVVMTRWFSGLLCRRYVSLTTSTSSVLLLVDLWYGVRVIGIRNSPCPLQLASTSPLETLREYFQTDRTPNYECGLAVVTRDAP